MDKRDNYSLKQHHTFGIDVACKHFVLFDNEEEAAEVAIMLGKAGEPFLVIGRGSNLLLTKDFPGIVVRSAMKGMAMHSDNDAEVLFTAQSGEEWDRLVAFTVEKGFGALANLSLIPGDVGASVVQNIGAYGVEVAQFVDIINMVEIGTGRRVAVHAADCHYGYRQSRFKQEWRNKFLITSVTFRLPRHAPLQLDYGNLRQALAERGTPQPTAAELRQAIIDIRRTKLPDPDVLGNAGSFFMNPVVSRATFEALHARYVDMPHYDVDSQRVKIPAAWLIDRCGWKGRSLGRAAVHAGQPLVLVNLGGATGAEVVALCNAVKADVEQQFGIKLQPEVNIY